jgi:hypothetical protein
MAGFADTRRAIEELFEAGFAVTGVALFFEGQPRGNRQTEYAALFVRDSAGAQIFLNQDHHRLAGVVVVQVFTPLQGGTQRPRELADRAAAVFLANKTAQLGASGLIRFATPSITAQREDGEWMQLNLAVAFERDVDVIGGLAVPITYTALTLTAPWLNAGGAEPAAAYLTSLGVTRLRGVLHSNSVAVANGAEIVSLANALPSYARPAAELLMKAGAESIRVKTDGRILYEGPGGAPVPQLLLNGVDFRADA